MPGIERSWCIVLGMKSAGIIAVVLLCIASVVEAQSVPPVPSPIANQGATKPQPRPSFTGRWEGVQVIQTEMPRVVADLVFTIKDAGGELSGETMFYGRVRDEKGKWLPVENFGSPMLSPHVEGKVLSFKLSFRTSEGVKKTMDYKMELIGPDEAIFDHAEETFVSMAAKMTRKAKK